MHVVPERLEQRVTALAVAVEGQAERFAGRYDRWWFAILGNHRAWIERVEPPSLLSYRWHPYAIEPGVDYSGEDCTLVTFTLQPSGDGGTLLTVVESGFDKVPAHRRADAFHMNSKGWEAQLHNIGRYVTQ